MKIIFIAGPFRGDGSTETKEKNVGIAKKFVHLFIENQIPYYSPHLNIDQEAIYLDENAGKLAWQLNAEILKRCDALAVLPGWENSGGTREEIENTTKLSLPIFYLDQENSIQEIINWMKNE
ncbi:MAG: DUF4406 domain-containing protein [Candidatus Paceibacterota bacterium]|jgi:putative NIF3 family GTP cyclohydrolase 1 type 2